MRAASCLMFAGFLMASATAIEAGGEKDKKAKKDEERLLGTWSMVSGEKDGEKAPEEIVREFRLTFQKEGKIQVKVEGRDMDGTYSIVSAKKPKEINFSVDGKDLEGIYTFEKENLKFCVGPAGARPQEYATQAGSMRMQFVLKREEK